MAATNRVITFQHLKLSLVYGGGGHASIMSVFHANVGPLKRGLLCKYVNWERKAL